MGGNGGKIAGLVLIVGGLAAGVWAWKAGVFGGTSTTTAAGTIPGISMTVTFTGVPAS